VSFTISGSTQVQFQFDADEQVEGAEVEFRGQAKPMKKIK